MCGSGSRTDCLDVPRQPFTQWIAFELTLVINMQVFSNRTNYRTRRLPRLSAVAAFLIVVGSCVSLNQTTAIAQESHERIWRDASGSFSVVAKLLESDGALVTLRTKQGKRISVPIDKLSVADRAFLRKRNGQTSKSVTPSATNKRIASKLAGPPLTPAETTLGELHKLLQLPVFVDVKAADRLGLNVRTPVTLSAGHKNLAQQLDATLAAVDMSWCTTQTVLVLTSHEALENRFVETRIYRFATPNRNFDGVKTQIERRVAPDSWESMGGIGVVQPFGSVYVIRQSPEVHRQLARDLNRQPLPRQYGHRFDTQSISISMDNAPIADILAFVSKQIDLTIEPSAGLRDVGLDLESKRHAIDIHLNGVSVKDALDLVLGQHDCTWVEQPGKLVVMTEEDALSNLAMQRFSIRQGPMRDANRVRYVVECCVAPDCWNVLGGEGELKLNTPRPGQYAVRQGQPAMRELEQLVRELQSLR